MTWLVVGSDGQLGSDLLRVLPPGAAVGVDLPEIDITDTDSVGRALARHRPEVVVNAAAFTAVDDAEDREELATQINGAGPRILARACAGSGTRLVHISTDYVFDGAAREPYPESAEPAPRSAYGRSKLVGERAVLAELPESGYVVRTAWLYGEQGNNFVKTMLRLEREKPRLSVVDDQRGQPTWSRDLAAQIVALVGAGASPGIYHATSSGETTWYGLTRAIFELIGADPNRVLPTTTAEFPRPAPRPAYSVLGHDAWAREGIAPMRDWRQALTEALPLLQARLSDSR